MPKSSNDYQLISEAADLQWDQGARTNSTRRNQCGQHDETPVLLAWESHSVCGDGAFGRAMPRCNRPSTRMCTSTSQTSSMSIGTTMDDLWVTIAHQRPVDERGRNRRKQNERFTEVDAR